MVGRGFFHKGCLMVRIYMIVVRPQGQKSVSVRTFAAATEALRDAFESGTAEVLYAWEDGREHSVMFDFGSEVPESAGQALTKALRRSAGLEPPPGFSLPEWRAALAMDFDPTGERGRKCAQDLAELEVIDTVPIVAGVQMTPLRSDVYVGGMPTHVYECTVGAYHCLIRETQRGWLAVASRDDETVADCYSRTAEDAARYLSTVLPAAGPAPKAAPAIGST